jgi:hypothetical protein
LTELTSRSREPSGHQRSKLAALESDDDTGTESEAESVQPKPVPAALEKLSVQIPSTQPKRQSPIPASRHANDEIDPRDAAAIQRALRGESDSDSDEPETPKTAATATPPQQIPRNPFHQHGKAAANVTALPGFNPGVRRQPAPPPASQPAPRAPGISPTPSQAALPSQAAPPSQASQTSHSSQPTRPSRHGSMKSPSVTTRSHCKYKKISLELYDDGPRVMFVVPGCSLWNEKHMREEDIQRHGDATVEDMQTIEGDIEQLAISDEIVSNLKLLVGVDLLRELEIFYLPQPNLPLKRRPRRVRRTDTALERRRDSAASTPRVAGPSGIKRKRADEESVVGSQRGSVGGSVSEGERRRRRRPAKDKRSADSSDDEEGSNAGTASVAHSTPPQRRVTLIVRRPGSPTPLGGPSGSQLTPLSRRATMQLTQDEYDSEDDAEAHNTSPDEDYSGSYMPSNGTSRQQKRRRNPEKNRRRKKPKIE